MLKNFSDNLAIGFSFVVKLTLADVITHTCFTVLNEDESSRNPAGCHTFSTDGSEREDELDTVSRSGVKNKIRMAGAKEVGSRGCLP